MSTWHYQWVTINNTSTKTFLVSIYTKYISIYGPWSRSCEEILTLTYRDSRICFVFSIVGGNSDDDNNNNNNNNIVTPDNIILFYHQKVVKYTNV